MKYLWPDHVQVFWKHVLKTLMLPKKFYMIPPILSK